MVSSASIQRLPPFSTASKYPTRSDARLPRAMARGISTLFMRLLNTSRHTRGWRRDHHFWLSPSSFLDLRLTGHEPRNTGHVFSAGLRQLCVSALSFSSLSLYTFKPFGPPIFQLRFSTTHYQLFTTHGPPHNFYPPALKLRHNPAAQGRIKVQLNDWAQPIPQTGRIQ